VRLPLASEHPARRLHPTGDAGDGGKVEKPRGRAPEARVVAQRLDLEQHADDVAKDQREAGQHNATTNCTNRAKEDQNPVERRRVAEERQCADAWRRLFLGILLGILVVFRRFVDCTFLRRRSVVFLENRNNKKKHAQKKKKKKIDFFFFFFEEETRDGA
jgi:hypothetical protein